MVNAWWYAACSECVTFQFCSYTWNIILVHSQPKGVEPKLRGHTLRSGVNLQGTLKPKGVKQMSVKQGLPVLSWQLHGQTEGNHKDFQDRWCPIQGLNHVSDCIRSVAAWTTFCMYCLSQNKSIVDVYNVWIKKHDQEQQYSTIEMYMWNSCMWSALIQDSYCLCVMDGLTYEHTVNMQLWKPLCVCMLVLQGYHHPF
jgi:hypothetical protein